MENSRKIEVKKCPLYQGDGGMITFEFASPRYYHSQDLSLLSAVLKVRFSDESTDGFALEKQTGDNDIALVWNIQPNQTLISGDAEGQVVFENDENTIVFNSDIFNFVIEPSIEMDFLSTSGETALEKLKREIDDKLLDVNAKMGEIDEKIAVVDDYLASDVVTTVNGQNGDVTITADSLSCATTTALNTEVNKIINGTYVAKYATEAQNDGDGNNIANTYLKISEYENSPWKKILSTTFSCEEITADFGFRCRKIYVLIDMPLNEDETPISVYARVSTKKLNMNKGISHGNKNDLNINDNPVSLSYRIEMCGPYAKVDKAIITGFVNGANDLKDSSTSTIGVNLNENFIDNITIKFFDNFDNEVYLPSASVYIYGY